MLSEQINVDSEVIDSSALGRLLDVIGGDVNDLVELIEEFESTTPMIMEKMLTGVETQDWESLRIQAHSLKSNARDFGAKKLAALCATLEMQCGDGNVVEPATQVSNIQSELQVARSALSTVVDQV